MTPDTLPTPDTVDVEPFDDMRPVQNGWHRYVDDNEPCAIRNVHVTDGRATGVVIGSTVIVAHPGTALAWRLSADGVATVVAYPTPQDYRQ